MRVAIQGTHGSFSEAAARRRWPELETLPCREAKDVVAAVRAGEADAGCLPIENSLIGSVTTTYDLLEEAFGDGTLRLTHEILYPVHHTIMAVPGARLDSIKRVLSHPVALGQCRIWLSEHLPNVELVSAWDTAGSAEMVAQEGNPALAAIAARHAADAHGLVSLAERIEDDPTNQTRFLTFTRAAGRRAPGRGRWDQPVQDVAHRSDRPQAGHARAHAAGLRRARRQPHGAAVAAGALGAVDLPLLRGHRRLDVRSAGGGGAGGGRGSGGKARGPRELRGLGGRIAAVRTPADAGSPYQEARHSAGGPPTRAGRNPGAGRPARRSAGPSEYSSRDRAPSRARR